jgi:lipid-A-disaccharide synthase
MAAVPDGQSGEARLSLDILLTCQQFGEFHHRVRPLATALETHLPAARLLLNVVGPQRLTIAAQAAALGTFAEVISDSIYRRTGYIGRMPVTSGLAPRGIIVGLSDHTVHARAIGFRTDWPVIAYSESHQRDLFGIQRLLLAEQGQYVWQRAHGHTPEQLAVVGPLIVDSVRPTQTPAMVRTRLRIRPQAPLVGLMAGTEPKRMRLLLPVFLQTVDALADRAAGVEFAMPVPEALPLEQIAQAAAPVHGTVVRTDGGEPILTTAAGRPVRLFRASWLPDLFQVFDTALVGPGANTAELACLGVPMIAVCPPGWPEQDPLLTRLRAWAGRLFGEQVRPQLVAAPNRKAGRPITPEIIGTVGPAELAAVATDLLGDGLKRREISLELRQVMGLVGASRSAAEQIWGVVRGRYPELDGMWVEKTAKSQS